MYIALFLLLCLFITPLSGQTTAPLIAYARSAPCPFAIRQDPCPGNIALLNIETGDVHVLDVSTSDPSTLRWSPQGDRVAFWSSFIIFVVNADGSDLHSITLSNEQDLGAPVWSPDGQQIATVVGHFNSWCDLYIVNADGTEPRQITHDLCVSHHVEWSPDGTQLLIEVYKRDSFAHIYLINADGTELTDITPHMEASNFLFADWSPDGSRIVFTTGDWRVHVKIYVMDSDGQNVIQLSPDDAFSRRFPQWVLGGSHITYYLGRPSRIVGVYLMDLQTLESTLVISTPFMGGTSTSSDGRLIAYVRGPNRRDTEICYTDLVTLAERCIEGTRPYFDASPQWQPNP